MAGLFNKKTKQNSTNNGNSNNNTNKERILEIRTQIIMAFSIIVPAVLIITILLFNSKMSAALKNQTANMIQNLNAQIKNNIDSSMKTIGDNINMVLADEDIVSYDPGNGSERAYG